MLEAEGEYVVTIIEAHDEAQAQSTLQSAPIDCVLLDTNLDDIDGMSFLPQIAACSITQCAPVIFLTDQEDKNAAVQAMQRGAADCLNKSALTRQLLMQAIKRAMHQQREQQRLLEQNALLNTLLETLPNPIFYRDKDGVYIGCNKAFETFVGFERNQIIGKTTLDVIRPKAAMEYFAVEADLIAQGGSHQQETWLYNSKGQMRNVIASKAGFKDAGGAIKGLVGVLVDITELKQMETALRKTGDELKQNIAKLEEANRRIMAQQKALIEEERLKVMLQMAGATAHELNQPLASLMGFIDLFEMDKDNPEKVTVYLDKIRSAGHRIANIVKKIQSIRPDQMETNSGDSTVITIDHDVCLLVIEDQDEDFDRLIHLLDKQHNFHISRARDFDEAVTTVSSHTFDVIILDYLLPSGNGLDLLAKFNESALDIPVIFSTGHGDEMIAAKALQAGAYDYIPKAKMDRNALLSRIAQTLEKHRLKKEVRQSVQKMAEMSVRDELTGLHNRRYMNELLDREFSRATRYDNDLSCLLIDIDFFKQINDSFGHIFGDFVLKNFAVCLTENVRESDFCFRYGGEEFLVLLPNTDIHGANNTAEKLRSYVESQSFSNDGFCARVTISVGSVSLKQHKPKAVKDMLAYADKALYRAKCEGRNRIKVYLEHTAPPNDHTPPEVDMAFFREQLSTIFEKNKKAALNALGLLLDQLGDDTYLSHHQKSLAQIDLMAKQLNLPVDLVDAIKRSAMLHNRLKILLPHSLRTKEGPLNNQDKASLEKHPALLAGLTKSFELFEKEGEILLHHQERFDGSGYPDGLKGDQIPLGARLYAIVNAVAAMVSERPYRTALDGSQVIAELIDNAGTQFDPRLVAIFLNTVEENMLLQLPKKMKAQKKAWMNMVQHKINVSGSKQ